MKILIALLAVSFFTIVLSEDPDETTTTVSTTSKGTNNATTDVTNSTTAEVTGSTTAEITGSTTAEVTGSTTAEITGSTTAEVTGSTTAEITGSTTAEVTGSTTAEITGSTTAEVTGSTTAGVTNGTTTEVASSSTTIEPNSTTTEVPSSSTTIEPNSTTTEVPSNTTTVAPETTTLPPVTPTVDPKPQKCDWNVTVGNVTCIKAEMKAQFVINIKGNDSYVNVGCHADLLDIDCPAGDTQKLIISKDGNYVLTMVFEKDSGKISTRNITLELTLPDGDKLFVYNDSEKLFTVSVGNSYLCNSDVDVHLENVTMKISDLHIQAFRENDDANFGTAEECNADDTVSDIIPIAVGVVLVALVLVVLIAYLIGRRRKSQKGYQTFQE